MVANRSLILGSGNFHWWYRTLAGLRQSEREFQALLKEGQIAGLEISVSFEDLSAWVDRLQAGRKALPPPLGGFRSDLVAEILNAPANTVHIPSLQEVKADGEKWFCEDLVTLYERTGIRSVTTHPDGVTPKQWEYVCAQLPAEIDLGVENMDPRKKSHQALEEVGELLRLYPRLSLVFDTAHWIENKKGLLDSELRTFFTRFSGQFKKLHFSVPTSKSEHYAEMPQGVTPHYLAKESGVEIPTRFFDLLPEALTVVIEGTIPPYAGVQPNVLLQEEIAYLRSNLGLPSIARPDLAIAV
jgi:hypothetical protein